MVTIMGKQSTVVAAVLALLTSSTVLAQMQRPVIQVSALPAEASVNAGDTVSVKVSVRLPPDVHVQADKPRDPSVLPTALTFTQTGGTTVEKIVYPAATDLVQSGRAEALSVFGGNLTIEARLAVPKSEPSGERQISATLRYQACTEAVCFPPARATVQWTLTVK
jgi:Disulphide bond corrector protein DsbC